MTKVFCGYCHKKDCEFCHPSKDWKVKFTDFYYEKGAYSERPLGLKGYLDFISTEKQLSFNEGKAEGVREAVEKLQLERKSLYEAMEKKEHPYHNHEYYSGYNQAINDLELKIKGIT